MNVMRKNAEYHLVNCGAYEEEYRDKGLFYDVTQHAVFGVDRLGRDILENWSGQDDEAIVSGLSEYYSTEEIREALDEIDQVLVPARERPPTPEWKAQPTRVKLHIGHNCNMQCRYCYAWDEEEEFYHSTEHTQMEPAVGFAAVDLILENATDSTPSLLTFHGGEPMLYPSLIVQMVEYVKERMDQTGKRVNMSIATNGTIFRPKIADLFAQRNVNVCISLDGDMEGNATRVFPDGSPSFPIVAENIKRYRHAGCVVSTQSTVHHHNLNLVNTAKVLRELGSISVLFNLNRLYESDYAISELDVWQLMREFDDLIRWEFSLGQRPSSSNGEPHTFVRNLDAYYTALRKNWRRFYYCDFGSKNATVAPNGDMYVCEYYTGCHEHALGNVLNGKELGPSSEQLNKLTVDNREPCKSCWARYICGGPCPYESVQLFGDPYQVADRYCDLYRSAIETVIAAYGLFG